MDAVLCVSCSSRASEVQTVVFDCLIAKAIRNLPCFWPFAHVDRMDLWQLCEGVGPNLYQAQ